MPYINKDRRDRMGIPETSGELNYRITKLFIDYTNEHGLCYNTINDVIGACEGAKLEFYRRLAGPYENNKMEEYRTLNNGYDGLYDHMI